VEERKRLKKFLRIGAAILLLAVSGFISGCSGGTFIDPGTTEEGTGEGSGTGTGTGVGAGSITKTLLITGIPVSSGQVVAALTSRNNNLEYAVAIAGGYGYIVNSTATIQLKAVSTAGDLTDRNWTGSGSYYIVFQTNRDQLYITSGKIAFSSEITTVSWSQFIELSL
jgi:hypothetical protein